MIPQRNRSDVAVENGYSLSAPLIILEHCYQCVCTLSESLRFSLANTIMCNNAKVSVHFQVGDLFTNMATCAIVFCRILQLNTEYLVGVGGIYHADFP